MKDVNLKEPKYMGLLKEKIKPTSGGIETPKPAPMVSSLPQPTGMPFGEFKKLKAKFSKGQ